MFCLWMQTRRGPRLEHPKGIREEGGRFYDASNWLLGGKRKHRRTHYHIDSHEEDEAQRPPQVQQEHLVSCPVQSYCF